MATAATDSTTGTALGTMQGSCRPKTETVVRCINLIFTVFCRFGMDGVGLTAQRKIIGIPEEIPPKMPP